jgi:hypothetical protein
MKLGIVGRPKTGKTTLFNLLTRSHQSVDKFGAVRETHLGTAHVPDPRLDRLSALFKPKKHTPATVDFVDVPGIAKGEQEKIDFSALKNVDALVHVLRAFEDADLPHEGGIDPARDAKMLDEELVLCDYVLLEKRREKLEKERKKTKSAELDAEWAAIEKCLPALEAATPLRAAALSPSEEKCLRGFTLLSLKPLLLVVNVSDADAAAEPVERFGLQGFASQPRVSVARAAAKIEMELNDLPDEDVPVFLADLGISERGIDRILRASYRLLGVQSFFTAGEDECRAWTVPSGATAVECAGTIHSDLARGFIRAEVVPVEDLLDLGSLADCRTKGRLKLEGKEYVVKDGDVVHVRFNV